MMQDTLGQRMKAYEQEYRQAVPEGKWIILRLDGRGFSRFTKKMRFGKPFDGVMSEMMSRTALALAKDFQAVAAYMQSDEITLVLPPYYTGFSRRSEKLIGCAASLAGAAFFKAAWELMGKAENDSEYTLLNTYNWAYLDNINEGNMPFLKNVRQKTREEQWAVVQEEMPTFDCRLFAVDTHQEAANAVLWRYNDAVKNSIIGLAQVFFTQKQLNKVNQDGQLAMLESCGIYWRKLPPAQQHGQIFVLVEKEKPKPPQYVKDGESPTVTRRVWKSVNTHPSSHFFTQYLAENGVSYTHRKD